MNVHQIAGGLCFVGCLFGFYPYVRDTLCGITKPHAFSWIVWGLTLGIAAAVAFVETAWVSAALLVFCSAMDFLIGFLAFRLGERHITRGDWVAFLSALAIIPLWVATKQPLLAAILVTTIDTIGYFPTIRKAWERPHDESLKSFSIFTFATVLGIVAIDPLTLVTGLYPFASLAMNAFVCLEVFFRRRFLTPERQGV